MRVQLRIVAGKLRGRKLTFTAHKNLRPAPQMLREALFSILGDDVPGRPFFDLFAGTGAVGLEAFSRGAAPIIWVERDLRLAREIDRHLKEFGIEAPGSVVRADAYRWGERWSGSSEPANLFLGPPYPDFQRRLPDLLLLVHDLQEKVARGSVLVLQAERDFPTDKLPRAEEWEPRHYGRNTLLIWVKR